MGTLTMAIASLLSPFLLSYELYKAGTRSVLFAAGSPVPSTVPGAFPEWALDICFDELKGN